MISVACVLVYVYLDYTYSCAECFIKNILYTVKNRARNSSKYFTKIISSVMLIFKNNKKFFLVLLLSKAAQNKDKKLSIRM